MNHNIGLYRYSFDTSFAIRPSSYNQLWSFYNCKRDSNDKRKTSRSNKKQLHQIAHRHLHHQLLPTKQEDQIYESEHNRLSYSGSEISLTFFKNEMEEAKTYFKAQLEEK